MPTANCAANCLDNFASPIPFAQHAYLCCAHLGMFSLCQTSTLFHEIFWPCKKDLVTLALGLMSLFIVTSSQATWRAFGLIDSGQNLCNKWMKCFGIYEFELSLYQRIKITSFNPLTRLKTELVHTVLISSKRLWKTQWMIVFDKGKCDELNLVQTLVQCLA